MSRDPSVPETMTFVQHQLPPLESGDYELLVQQKLGGAAPASFPADKPRSQAFSVQGARYSLPPQMVTSTFPPNNHTGDFDNCLPHVVVGDPTLPWERDPDGVSLAAANAPADVAPWLAVITLGDDDFPSGGPAFPALQTLTVGAVAPVTRDVFFPSLAPERADDPAEACQVIDVPTALFNRIAPREDELAWLAHARLADNGGAAAVVFGNRFPSAGVHSQAYLVSLEGYGGRLPTAAGPKIDPTQFASVRLVVLATWGFTADVLDGRQFADLLKHLNDSNAGPGTLRLPTAGVDDTSVASILEAGYVALPHMLRTGDRTASMYRGPFIPRARPRDETVAPAVVSVSDTLLHYDPKTGLFDAAYAAAWQLGRMLGLSSKQFSAAIYAWREGNVTASARAANHIQLHQTLPPAANVANAPDGRVGLRPAFQAVLRDALSTSLCGLPGPASAALTAARRERSASAEPRPAKVDAPPVWLGDNLPSVMSDWLAGLALCDGVPFEYLVPDPRMLPPESIRFFQVDPNWIASLVGGALSIGRRTGARAAHDDLASGAVQAAAGLEEDTSVASGFLIRSSVVQGWPHLHIDAYADGGRRKKLSVDRVDVLAPTVLLCIVTGTAPIALLDLQEPSDGAHFGVAWTGSSQDAYTKELRNPTSGQPVDPRVPGEVSADRTLDVVSLARAIQAKLIEAGLDGRTFTAAEFGLQMIEGVAKVTFTVPS
jgi:hypothetical protein